MPVWSMNDELWGVIMKDLTMSEGDRRPFSDRVFAPDHHLTHPEHVTLLILKLISDFTFMKFSYSSCMLE